MNKSSFFCAGVNILSGCMIEGVNVVPLVKIPDERGTIFHMLRSTDSYFCQFGEIYFSTVYRGVVKGWHQHKKMTLNYACVFGMVKIVLFDEREGSETYGSLMEIFIGVDNYALVIVPPGVWNGFKGMSEPFAMIANCATHPHDRRDSKRIDPYQNHIPYDWNLKCS